MLASFRGRQTSEKVLERAAKEGIITVTEPLELEALARIIVAVYHAIALQIIHNPSLKGDQKIWDTARKMLLGGLL